MRSSCSNNSLFCCQSTSLFTHLPLLWHFLCLLFSFLFFLLPVLPLLFLLIVDKLAWPMSIGISCTRSSLNHCLFFSPGVISFYRLASVIWGKGPAKAMKEHIIYVHGKKGKTLDFCAASWQGHKLLFFISTLKIFLPYGMRLDLRTLKCIFVSPQIMNLLEENKHGNKWKKSNLLRAQIMSWNNNFCNVIENTLKLASQTLELSSSFCWTTVELRRRNHWLGLLLQQVLFCTVGRPCPELRELQSENIF